MENKETSIEWFVSQLPLRIQNSHATEIEKAKQMHKEQIMQAVYDSMGINFDPNMGRAELYYNETFKQPNNEQ